jgi:hypothetical protein
MSSIESIDKQCTQESKNTRSPRVRRYQESKVLRRNLKILHENRSQGHHQDKINAVNKLNRTEQENNFDFIPLKTHCLILLSLILFEGQPFDELTKEIASPKVFCHS